MERPLAFGGPECRVELVLHEEKPNSDRAGDQDDRQMHEQERSYAEKPDQGRDNKRDGKIRGHGAEPGAPATAQHADRKPLLQDEEISWSDPEHHNRVPIKPVAKPA